MTAGARVTSLMVVMAGSHGVVELMGMFNDRLLACRVWANTRRRGGLVGMGSIGSMSQEEGRESGGG